MLYTDKEFEIEVDRDILIYMSCNIDGNKIKIVGCGYIIYKKRK